MRNVFASFTLVFALQMSERHGKPSVRLRKTSVRVQYTYNQNTHTLQNLHTRARAHHNPPPPHTPTHITKQYKTTTVQIKTNHSTRYTQMKQSIYNQIPAV
jgi:hypothetical protein